MDWSERPITRSQEALGVAKRKNTSRGKAKVRPTNAPTQSELMRAPDITATATLRLACGVCVRVTHPEYMPNEVVALIRQGHVQLEPVVPGQVGTLILDGFPYTVLGYYTFSEQNADYEVPPDGWSCHVAKRAKHRQ